MKDGIQSQWLKWRQVMKHLIWSLPLVVIICSLSIIHPVLAGDNTSLVSWENNLAAHENCPVQGKIDTNGKMSYGSYCFQAKTFLWNMRQANLMPGATDSEILDKVGNNVIQIELVTWLAENKPKQVKWEWYNSIRWGKVGMPPSGTV